MRSPVPTLLAGLAFLTLVATASARFRLIEMRGASPERIAALRSSGAYEVLEVHGDRLVVVEDLDFLASRPVDERVSVQLMRSAYRIQQQDLDDVFAPFRAQGSEGAYHSVAEVTSEIQAMAAAHPDRVELVEIGRSVEDRPLVAVRVGKRDGVERPAAIFMGMIHAREWISTEMAMGFLGRLVEPADDPELAALLEDLTVYVIPVLNPDGLQYSQSEYRWWRGNRRPNPNGTVGVDLNRNFPTGWGIGSSSQPGSQTYRGPEPLSEPESAAFDALVGSVKPVVTMTWHAYGRMVLLPFGYQSGYPGRQDRYEELGPAMKAAAPAYTAGAIHELIGVVGGATDDHFLVAHGSFVATLELASSFIPPESQIPSLVAEAMPAAMVWLKAVPQLQGLDPRQPPAARELRFQRLHGE